MTTRARLKIALISVGMLLVFSSAAQTVAAAGSVNIDWVGTYSITNLDTGATTWFQVSVALAGRPPNPTIVSGSGTVAVCLRPPNPSIPFICDVDQSTLQSFGATGTLTTDLTSAQRSLTWVVQNPGSQLLPGGSKVRIDFVKTDVGKLDVDTVPFTVALPDGTQLTGNSILLCKGC